MNSYYCLDEFLFIVANASHFALIANELNTESVWNSTHVHFHGKLRPGGRASSRKSSTEIKAALTDVHRCRIALSRHSNTGSEFRGQYYKNHKLPCEPLNPPPLRMHPDPVERGF
jgi:hypothetical protein